MYNMGGEGCYFPAHYFKILIFKTAKVRIQYGGSVTADNVDELMRCPGSMKI